MAVTIIIEYDFNQSEQHLLSCILEQFGEANTVDILVVEVSFIISVPGNRL